MLTLHHSGHNEPMRHWFADPLHTFADAITTAVGWTVVIVTTLLLGFTLGYWIGHGRITGTTETVEAMALIPVVWLGWWQMFIAYAVTGLSLYLPLRFEERWLYAAGAIANLLTWLIVVAYIVDASADGKFWQW